MRSVQDIVIFVAKILIFIGDITILVFTLPWKALKLLKIPHQKKVVEREIYSISEPPKKKKSRQYFKFYFKYPTLAQLKERVNIPRIKFQLPTFKLPEINLPTIKRPNVKPPRIVIPKIKLPSLKHLHFRLRHKKRGRPKLPRVVPFGIRIKYVFIGTLLSFVFLFLPMVFVIFVQNLPNPSELSHQEIAQTTKIYDRNKTLLYQIYANQNRTNVPLSDIPENLRDATIAIEDKNFYTTPGFDALAMVRSAVADLSGKPLQGGSTITQQLIKARLLTPERSIERKIKEVILAVWAEGIYSKEEILEMYFNQVPYGGTSWGVEAAAQTYFGKNVKDLNLSESAFLAGIPQAPSVYSPHTGSPNAWKNRQKDVLSKMTELGFISKVEAKKAESEKLNFRPPHQILHAPHFVMYVKEHLVDKYGLAAVERGGLTVITSLDLKTQNMAQKIVADEVENSGYLNFTNAAALITSPKNGDILAMVGGKDYYDPNGGNYNVTTALRQPGSTIKVVTYAAALLNGYTAATLITDTPVSFASAGAPPYSPVNYDGRFHGTVTLRNALGNSINIPAVKTLNQVGIKTMMDLAKRMGIQSWGEPEEYGLALTLGSAEVRMTDMASVYGSLANKGKKVDINPILKVTNYQGATLEEKKEIKQKSVIPEEIAFIISSILADNSARAMEFGLNSPLVIRGHSVSVKTGTTDNKRDNWTIGYTPNVLTAVWVGNNDNTPMNPILASGITGAAPIWNKIMNNLLSKKSPKEDIYTPPNDIVVKPCGGKNEYFIKGTEKMGNCRPISINDQKPNSPIQN